MKYLCLIYDEDQRLANLAQADMMKMVGEYGQFTEWLKKDGHLLASERLQPATNATSVRVRDGKQLVTDGPFAETREQLGGFYMVEAKDLDEAIAIAGKIPSARYGTVEVRPVFQMPARATA